jgi:uncharacterized protein (TIGR02284 family)
VWRFAPRARRSPRAWPKTPSRGPASSRIPVEQRSAERWHALRKIRHMATLSGRDVDLKAVLRKLIELDADASSAYRAALNRLEDLQAKRALEGFLRDHARHDGELRSALIELGGEPPDPSSVRQVLTKGRILIGNLVGDHGVLRAMCANENDINVAYELALGHTDLTPALKAVLQRGLDDERRHRTWIEERLTLLGNPRRSSA